MVIIFEIDRATLNGSSVLTACGTQRLGILGEMAVGNSDLSMSITIEIDYKGYKSIIIFSAFTIVRSVCLNHLSICSE